MKQINWSDHILNFLAVIIGVSLAFYISSNAEKKKEKEEFRQIIRSLIEEIETDITVYEKNQIPRNQDQSAKITEVLEMLKSGSTDSLIEKVKASMNFSNYSPRNVTFNSISASGKLDLIENFELRKQITFYHEIWAAEAQFQGERQIDFYKADLLPWVMKNTDITKPDVNDLIKREFKNLLFMYQSLINTKVRRYQKVVAEGKLLIEELELLLE